MLVILWEYHVQRERVAEFEEVYSPNGAWTKLFRKAEGFLGTELLRDINHPCHYVTVDRWSSSLHYEGFLAQWLAEYSRLDAKCEGLTEQETLLGKWESVQTETG